MTISFFVPGVPRPGGSKRVFPIKKAGAYTGRFIVTDAAGQANKDWRASVAHAAREAIGSSEPWVGPILLVLDFSLPRPKGHFRSDGVTVKESAPKTPVTRPDVGKLARSTTDALTAILWRDDAQVIAEAHKKRYAASPGCLVTVSKLDEDSVQNPPAFL